SGTCRAPRDSLDYLTSHQPLATSHLYPSAVGGTAGDRLAEPNLAVAVGEGRELGTSTGRPAFRDPVVNVDVKLLEGIRKALDMPPGIVGHRGGGRAEQSGIAREDLVRPVARPDPEPVGRLAVPGDRGLGARDLDRQAILAAGGHLGDVEDA